MKQSKKQNLTKAALFAGATALMALTPQAHAQSNVDALLNKLEQKGILTVDEARQLKAENQENATADFNKAFGSKITMPDWVTGYKLSGDFRGRFDEAMADDPSFVDRIRLRYRLRVGLVVNMKDDLQVGFRLGSGDATGNPLSANTTLENNGTKKPVWIDAAYGKWTPINDGVWMAALTVGKMDQPFQFTPMMFDPDYTPEGAALNASYKINDHHSLAFNGGAFVLDEESGSTHDPFMYGAQVLWNAAWTSRLATSLGIGAFDIVSHDMLVTANVPDNNTGNTRVGGALVNNYNPIIVSGSATYKLDSFPLYPGAFPIKLAGEFIDNPGADSNNKGYWAGITFGQSGKKHTWDISYRYEYLEADAWYEELVDDDNVAFYPAASALSGAGLHAGTNIKGHVVKANYSLTDSLTFTFACYANDLIKNPSPNSSSALHVMADIMWKF